MTQNRSRCLFFLFLLPLFSFSQQEASVWFIGPTTQVNFQTGDFEIVDSGLNSVYRASVCDENGNLLLYTNGKTIWNASNEILLNGTNLINENYEIIGNPVFVPYPGKEGHYLLFYVHQPKTSSSIHDKKLVYAEIDCQAENNRGEVLFKDEFLHDDFHDQPTVAGFCSNSYYWLTIDGNDNFGDPSKDHIYFYKIDEEGVHKTPNINGHFDIGHSSNYKFSPNGDKLFFSYGYNQAAGGTNIIADFNFLTGEMYNYRDIKGDPYFFREFSPDSRYFYYIAGNQLIQANVESVDPANFTDSKTLLLKFPVEGDGLYNGSSLQLAPDGSIYFMYYDPEARAHKIGRINYPNRKGMNCDPELDIYTLKESVLNFPNFVTSFFRDKEPEYIDRMIPDAGPPLRVCSQTNENLGASDQSAKAFYQWFPEEYISDPFVSQTIVTAPKTEDDAINLTYTLRATDGNCWLEFDSTRVTFLPWPPSLVVDGSWSVCPYVGEVSYWTDDNTRDAIWYVDGGEVAEITAGDSVKINWWDTNFDASVNAYYISEDGCYSDSAAFPVRINVELITETPKGPQDLCLAEADSLVYQIRNTNGSEYFWRADDGEILSGQGSNMVLVAWKKEGEHTLTVEETSTTIDTICYGESNPVLVQVLNDSLDIELASVSFSSNDNIIDLNYQSEKFDANMHYLSVLVFDGNGTFIEEVPAHSSYVRSEETLYPETLQLKVVNRCNETFYSNKQETIVLNNAGFIQNSAELAWNNNRFWGEDRIENELWHSVAPDNGWEILENVQTANHYNYANESLQLEHYFRVRTKNLDNGAESWSNILHVEFDDQITIPDVFTPNGDGYNDVWEIGNIEYHEFQSLAIFNRYGQKVYGCENAFIPWDGKTSNGIKQGTYFYELHLGADNTRYGQITLLQ